jgi:predicted S18 family serine protease
VIPNKRGDLGLTSKSAVEAKARAEAIFKKKENQLKEATEAMAEYQAANRALAERTARLRQLRLAKEAAEASGNNCR